MIPFLVVKCLNEGCAECNFQHDSLDSISKRGKKKEEKRCTWSFAFRSASNNDVILCGHAAMPESAFFIYFCHRKIPTYRSSLADISPQWMGISHLHRIVRILRNIFEVVDEIHKTHPQSHLRENMIKLIHFLLRLVKLSGDQKH